MPSKSLALAVFAASMALTWVTFAQSPQKPPVVPIITGVELRPAATLLVQPCPVVLVFHGEISTTRPAAVTYTWVDSRGRTWPAHRRRFSFAGVNAVTHKWRVGKPGKTVDEWVQLKVISPESRVSSKVPVHFTCAK